LTEDTDIFTQYPPKQKTIISKTSN